MTMVIYDPGDSVGYPEISDEDCLRRMTVIERNYLRYTSGKSYTQYLLDGLLEHLAEDMHANVDNDFDNLVVVSGKEGSGKSNMAYHLCKLYDPNFTIEDGYVYEYSSFIDKLTESSTSGADRGKIFWMDEATNVASNRDSMQRDNKNFIQMLEMMRSRGWTLVMCIPSVSRLDKYIREYRLRYLLICKEMAWGTGGRSRGYVEVKIQKGHELWGTLGYARFPKMEPEVKAEYERIKMSHQNEKMAEFQGQIKGKAQKAQRDTAKIRALALYAFEHGAKYVDIAVMTGYSKEYVKDILQQARCDRAEKPKGVVDNEED